MTLDDYTNWLGLQGRSSLYHGTNNTFDKFSLDYSGQRYGTFSNAALGVWLATDPKHAARFGQYVMEVHLLPMNWEVFALDDLVALNTQAQRLEYQAQSVQGQKEAPIKFYQKVREDYLNQGVDALALQERDGSIRCWIVLDPTKLEIIKVLGAKDILESETYLDFSKK